MNSTHRYDRKPGTAYSDNQRGNFRIAQRNFLSHAEFPDVKSAAGTDGEPRKTYARNKPVQQNPSKKLATFRPFDPNTAPANFQNCKKIGNNQNIQQINPGLQNGTTYYIQQEPAVYKYIPPQEYGRAPAVNVYAPSIHMSAIQNGPSATAVAPNGEKIFIPLDDSKYEIRRGDHDLYDMPQDCDLYALPSEGQFESNVLMHSPRPVDLRGSLSDEWSGSSQDGPYSDTESEHETEEGTETDASDIANNFVAEVLKTITINSENLNNDKDNISRTAEDEITEKSLLVDNAYHNFEISAHSSPKNCDTKKIDDNDIGSCPKTGEKIETDMHIYASSSSGTEETVIPKRAKVSEESKNVIERNKKQDSFDEELRMSKNPKSKMNRAWKENRKDKHNKSKTKIKTDKKEELEMKGKSTEQNDRGTMDTIKQVTTNIPEAEQGNIPNKTVENQETIVVDGHGYFKTQQYQNSPYQTYYIPDNYTFVPNYYQQCQQYSSEPEYTMFIHDACPPPPQDQVFGQVHKSLSGELINCHAQAYQPQTLVGDGRLQHTDGNGHMTSDNASNTHTSSFYGENCENPTCANGPSYTWSCNETQPVFNQVQSGTSTDTMGQQQSEGQIYISYDEDSVYVDPETGLSYPALHMADDFLITVILREGIFLEITADKVLRLVNHDKKLVVAINETGTKTCVIHPAARIYQSETSVHAELYLGRRAKMTEELILFGNESKTYKFDNRMVTEMTEEPMFRDLSGDESFNFVSKDDVTGNGEMKLKMEEILTHAHFWKKGTCGSTVLINGTKVVQNEKGEVSVYCGPIKFLRMNPEKMILRLKTQFVEVDIETNWNVKITRGAHALNASHMGFIVCNGKIKACLDNNSKLQSFSMPDHRFLMLGQPISQHRPGVPGGQRSRPSNRKTEAEGDHWGYMRRDAGEDQTTFREWEEYWESDFDNPCVQKRWDPQAGRWVYPSQQWNWR